MKIHPCAWLLVGALASGCSDEDSWIATDGSSVEGEVAVPMVLLEPSEDEARGEVQDLHHARMDALRSGLRWAEVVALVEAGPSRVAVEQLGQWKRKPRTATELRVLEVWKGTMPASPALKQWGDPNSPQRPATFATLQEGRRYAVFVRPKPDRGGGGDGTVVAGRVVGFDDRGQSLKRSGPSLSEVRALVAESAGDAR